MHCLAGSLIDPEFAERTAGAVYSGCSGTRVDVPRNRKNSSRRDHQGVATMHEAQQDTVTLVPL